MTGTAAFITTDFSPGSIPPIPGGCAYYRCFLPMQAMRIEARLGLPAWTGEDGFGIQSDKNEALFGFDLVVMKLLMDRRLPNQMRMAQALGQKIIVDVDDFYDDLPESNLAHEATDPTLHKFANREHYREIILTADMVTVTTPFLLDYYSRIHPCVRMIRNGVLPEQFDVRKVRDRKPVLGWVGGVPWRGGDLETMRGWLPDFLEKHDLMFHHAGHAEMVPGSDRPVQPIWELTGIPRERITTSPLRVLDEYHLMFDFDIGLIPLNDIPFNHAKSCLKGLEYSASGIPFVASALPEYEYLAQCGVGRIAYDPDDWVRHLEALLDYRTRKRDARINLENVRRDHSIMARETEWQAVVSELLG